MLMDVVKILTGDKKEAPFVLHLINNVPSISQIIAEKDRWYVANTLDRVVVRAANG